MAEGQIITLTPERLSELLQNSGYRVERRDDPNGVPVLASATGGMSFSIRFGNRAQPPAEGFLDFTYISVLKIEGEFSLERVNDWNKNKRFSRMHRVDDLIIFDMDVVTAAGVTERHLRASLELWDRLVQELIAWLRTDPTVGAANAA